MARLERRAVNFVRSLFRSSSSSSVLIRFLAAVMVVLARLNEHWFSRIHSMHSAGPWPISIQLLYFHLMQIKNQSATAWIDYQLNIIWRVNCFFFCFVYRNFNVFFSVFVFVFTVSTAVAVVVIAKCRSHAFYCTDYIGIGKWVLSKAHFSIHQHISPQSIKLSWLGCVCRTNVFLFFDFIFKLNWNGRWIYCLAYLY